MIKIRIEEGKKVKVKVACVESDIVREIAFGMACCINKMSYGKADFDRIKQDVIRELMMITLTENGEAFVIGFDAEE